MPQPLLDELELIEVEIVTDIMLLEDDDDLVGYVVETVELDTTTIEMLITLDEEIEVTDIFAVEVMVEVELLEEEVEIAIAELEEIEELLDVHIEEMVEIVYGEMVELEEVLEMVAQINDDVCDEMVDAQCIETDELEVVEDNETVKVELVDIDEMFYEDNIDSYQPEEHYIIVVLYDVVETDELDDTHLSIGILLDMKHMEELDEMVEPEQMLKCSTKH